jgi:hypothetical protein
LIHTLTQKRAFDIFEPFKSKYLPIQANGDMIKEL